MSQFLPEAGFTGPIHLCAAKSLFHSVVSRFKRGGALLFSGGSDLLRYLTVLSGTLHAMIFADWKSVASVLAGNLVLSFFLVSPIQAQHLGSEEDTTQITEEMKSHSPPVTPKSDQRFGPRKIITTDADEAWAVYASDLDGDGDQDVLSASFADDKVAWYENDGSGSFSNQDVITYDANGAFDVYATDLDGDGDQDVLSASTWDDKIAWYENDGSGSFSNQKVISDDADGAFSVYAADLDGDGDQDVMAASWNGDKITWYENNGSGTFSDQKLVDSDFYRAEDVYSEDLDGDGDKDLLATAQGENKVVWYENDGSGSFSSRRVISTEIVDGERVHAEDLDGDGDMDVLYASDGDDKIAWYENDGTGNFSDQKVITTEAIGATSVYAADADGDGDPDVFSVSRADDKVAWYENDGSGSFSDQKVITSNADGANELSATDLDGDSDTDVLSSSEFDDTVAWYENQGGTSDLPSAPTGLIASAEDCQVSLSWNANSEHDLAGYNLYRSTSSFSDTSSAKKINEAPVQDTSYADSGLENGPTYYYRVTAVDTAETEGPPSGLSSAQWEVFTTAEEDPELIGGRETLQDSIHYPEFARKAGIEGRVRVEFTVNEDGNACSPTVTKEAHPLLNDEALETVKRVDFDPALEDGAPVKFRMTLPVVFSLTTVPTGVTASQMNDKVSLSWNGDPENELSGFNIYRSTAPFDTTANAQKINNGLVVDTSYVDSDLEEGVAYYYRLTGVDSEGDESLLSAQVSQSLQRPQPLLSSVQVRPEGESSFDTYAPSEVASVHSGADLRFEGVVTDTDGNPIPNIQVDVYNSFEYAPEEEDDGVHSVTTSSDGTFQYPAIDEDPLSTASLPAGVRPFWFNATSTDEAIPFALYIHTEENTIEKLNEKLAGRAAESEDILSMRVDTSDENPYSELLVRGQSYPPKDTDLESSLNDDFFLYYATAYAGPTDKNFLLSETRSTGWLRRGFDLYQTRVDQTLDELPERFEEALSPASATSGRRGESAALKQAGLSDEGWLNAVNYAWQGTLCIGSAVTGAGASVGCMPLAYHLAEDAARATVKTDVYQQLYCRDLSESQCEALANIGIDAGVLIHTVGGIGKSITDWQDASNLAHGNLDFGRAQAAIQLGDDIKGITTGSFDLGNSTAQHIFDDQEQTRGIQIEDVGYPAGDDAGSRLDIGVTLPRRPALRYETAPQFDDPQNPNSLNVVVESNRAIFDANSTAQSTPALQIGGTNFSTSRVNESVPFRYRKKIPVSELPGYNGDPSSWNETIRVTGTSFETLQGNTTGAFCGIEEETFNFPFPQSSKTTGNGRTANKERSLSKALDVTNLTVPSNAFEGSTSFVDFTHVSYNQVARSDQPSLRPRSPVVQVKTNRAFTNPATLTLGLDLEEESTDDLNLYWRGESSAWQQVDADISRSDSTATAEVSLSGYYAVLEGGGASPPTDLPVQVQLAFPTDGTDGVPEAARLSWQNVDKAAQYRVQLSSHPDFPSDSLREYTAENTALSTDRLERETTYYWRVRGENSAGGGPWSETVQFSTRLASVAFDVSQSFGGAEEAGDYRLVALPGQVERPLGDAVSGEAGSEWHAFWDDGSAEDYLARYDGSETFAFRPGRGFWLTSRQEWSLTDSVKAVPLGEDQATKIPLHEGWNIISNPMRENVPWSAVESANSDSLQPAWAFDGSFQEADTLGSASAGQAYYFLNDQGLDSLTVPYPSAAKTEPKRALATEQQGQKSKESGGATSMALIAEAGDSLRSEARVGIGQGAAEGMDSRDVVAPLSRFSALSLRLEPSAEHPDRRGRLATEWRPPATSTEGNEDGHTFSLRLRAEASGPANVKATGLEAFQGQEVALLRPSTGRSWDLREKEAVTLRDVDSTALKLAVGSAAYVEDQEQNVVPDKVTLTSYPNPLQKQGKIEYTIPEATDVQITVYDVLGRRVAVLEDSRQKAGRHTARLDGGRLASGVYFGRLETEDQTRTQKITIVR